jgi:hypothetical protein
VRAETDVGRSSSLKCPLLYGLTNTKRRGQTASSHVVCFVTKCDRRTALRLTKHINAIARSLVAMSVVRNRALIDFVVVAVTSLNVLVYLHNNITSRAL